MITSSARSGVEVTLADGRSAWLEGEALLRGHGSPDFVLYRSSLTRWSDATPMSVEDVEAVLEDVRRSAAERAWSIEVE